MAKNFVIVGKLDDNIKTSIFLNIGFLFGFSSKA
jgi:hypothetical protein